MCVGELGPVGERDTAGERIDQPRARQATPILAVLAPVVKRLTGQSKDGSDAEVAHLDALLYVRKAEKRRRVQVGAWTLMYSRRMDSQYAGTVTGR